MTATLDTALTVDMAQPYGPAPTPPGAHYPRSARDEGPGLR